MKRAIALFLALVFVFTLIPVSALAAGTGKLTLTVSGGTQTPMGDHTDGAMVTVAAGAAEANKQFKSWTPTGDTDVLTGYAADKDTFDATVNVGDVNRTLALTSTYGAIGKMELTIVGGKAQVGTGTAAATVSAKTADDVTITADAAPAGKEFDKWIVTAGGSISNLKGFDSNDDSDVATVFVPADEAKTMTLTATYKDETKLTITFESSGVATEAGGDDDFVTSLPVTADEGATVYVRVASNMSTETRRVTGISITEDDGGATVEHSAGVVGEDGFTTYSFDMPDSPVTVRTLMEYKVSLYGATGTFTGVTDGFAKPGAAITLTLNADPHDRIVKDETDATNGIKKGWVFVPKALGSAESGSATVENVGDALRVKGSFTMPNEPVAITIHYDRELESNTLTVVNGTLTYENASGEDVTGTTAELEEKTEVTVKATSASVLIANGTLPAGYEFKGWAVAGDDDFITYINTLTLTDDPLTVVMPRAGGTLTAQYVGKYDLTTEDVAEVQVGGAKQTANATIEVDFDDSVMIIARDNVSGVSKFDHWTYTRAGVSAPSGIDETTAGVTKFKMPPSGAGSSGSLTVKAHYQYALTLTSGTASGLTPAGETATQKAYWVSPGETVTIVADDPDTTTNAFKEWTTTSAGVTLADVNAGTTTFTMPENAVAVEATYATAYKASAGNSNAAISITGQSVSKTQMIAAAGTPLTATAAATVTVGGTIKAFKQWVVTETGSTTAASLWADATGGTTVNAAGLENRILNFYMPDENVTITPEYDTGYPVGVTNGTGGGYYCNGDAVTIEAMDLAGKEFTYWTFTYYDSATATTTTTTQVASSSYTFTMGADVYKYVSAVATYTQLYSLTLQNNANSVANGAAGLISMTRPAKTTEPAEPEKAVVSTAGQTAISAYWRVGDVITITTPASVTDEDGAASTFAAWRIVSGSGTFADATSNETTFTVAAANTVIAPQYGANMLIYKTKERDSVHLYDNWEYAAYAKDYLVQLTAEDPDNTFVRWACEPEDLIRDADKGNPTISFKMPEGTAKIWPEYGHSLILTDGEYSINGGTSWTLGGGTPVSITTGDTVIIRPIEDTVGSTNSGKLLFKGWQSNSTRIGTNATTKQLTFTMPPEDVEASVVYQTYTLTVNRKVNGETEYFYLHPGEYITLLAEEASGGRSFNYWTHTDGLTFTVVDKFDPNNAARLLTQEITVQMPANDAFIHAWYNLYPRYDYWNTDAFIRVEGEPKRYYALLEYFGMYDMKVIYYPSLGAPGVEVDRTDYEIQIVKAGTDEVATTSDLCFTQTGAFDMIITMKVNGYQMAPAIRVFDTASTHLYCINTRPEFTQTFTKPSRTVYYEGEEVSKDGLDVLLRSADHTGGAIRYSTVREMDESEYKLKPWGTGWDADGYTNTKLPTIAQIDKILQDTPNRFGYKIENGRYYVCMEVTDCFDYTQYNTDGSYMRMEYVVNDAADYIWVEVKAPVNNISLEAIKGDNTSDVINNVETTTYPFVSWEISDDLATAQSGVRKLKVNADGYTDPKDIAAGLEYVISDSNVAYLEATNDPLIYNVKIKSTGVTTIKFRALGNPDVYATCEITVKTDVTQVAMTDLELNKSSMNLYVGAKFTLYPAVYAPSNANTACNWYVSFSDNLLPQNASYYVSVSEAGALEVLKYTDRPVRVWALPSYPAGGNTYDATTNSATGVFAYCDITVLQIPVDNMTLNPAALTMYRLASKTLKATLYPEAASDKTIRWTSTDSSVASVDNEGRITANKIGTATITATSESNTKVYQTCKVTVAESVLLTGLTLNKTSATLGIEDTLVLTPYYSPSTATTQSVSWSSNATTVATVDANGKVRGISEGVAVITATANDGSGRSVSCVVSVSTIVTSAVVLNKQTLALIEDETETLVATVYPTNVSNSKVNWSSSNANVAAVDPDGVVTAVGGGSAVISATAKDASTKYADCVVVVTAKIPVTAITLNLGDFDMLLNDTTILTPTVSPTNATYKVTWTSSDTSVASIDEKGKLSGLKTGTAIVTCKAGDMTKAITVNVVTKTFSTGKVVNCTRRVNVRANSSGTSTILGYAYLGDVYKVLDKTTNWYKIQYNASTTAYIWSRYLSATETSAGYTSAGKVGSTTTDPTATATPTTVTAKSLTITNCTYCVNVRSGAGTTFSKLGYAYKDEVLTYTGTQGDWYIITYNGATAYVSSQFVRVNS